MADNAVNEAFRQLLCAGLWQQPEAVSSFPTLNAQQWQRVIEIARSTQLDGIVYDGITRLKPSLRPGPAAEAGIMRRATQLISHHFHHNALIDEITGILSDAGIKSIILKGQSVAACYATPMRRNCGDIDIYVGPDNFNRTMELLVDRGIAQAGKIKCGKMHDEFEYKGVPIEMHRRTTSFTFGRYAAMMDAWEREALVDGDCQDVVFMTFFLFNHAFRHLCGGDPRLRQYVDLARYLYINHAAIDAEALRRRLKQFNLLSAWRKVGCFLVEYFHLPSEMVPLYSDRYRSYGIKLCRFQNRYATISRIDFLPAHLRHGTVRAALYTYRYRMAMWHAVNTIFAGRGLRGMGILTRFSIRYALRGLK